MGSKSAIGIGNGICFKQVRDKGGGSYIDPLVRDSLVGVWIADQNTNESPTRNIIKNKIKDKGGDLELLNFGYKLNSGYGGYIEDFSLFTLSNRFEYSKISNTKITITAVLDNGTGIYHNVTEEDSALYWNTFKIKVSGSTDDVYISYTTKKKSIRLYNGINTVVVPNELSWHSFSASKANTSCNITLEFVPLYEGALVTDGKDDLIASTKTVSEMGITDEVTVVSLVHQVSLNSAYNKAFTNYLEILDGSAYIRNDVVNGDKTGIYGYTSKLNTDVATVINNILGDKSDYGSYSTNIYNSLSNTKFSVVGRISEFRETSSVAWYWTFIANKVLTTDQINQVISYFNLDKHVKPDIIYDTIRQGITNENHASFNDELVDFSGNGHNMKLYNLNWDKQSGIGSYPFSFKDYNYFSDRASVSVSKSDFVLTANFDGNNFLEINTKNTEVPSFKIKAEGIDTITNGRLAYRIAASDGSISVKYISEDGEYEIPGSPLTENAAHSGFYVSGGINDNVRVKVTIIPDYEGALVSDGIDDYGKVENLPIYKDYTVVADREMLGATNGGVFLKGEDFKEGAFSFDYTNESSSFGGSVQKLVDTKRLISYQSKYVNNGININAGTATDTDKLWLAKLGNSNKYSKLALWSLLLFPYSLSEFLLERQLKKYKLGTLYPDMVEFRPIIKNNNQYRRIDFYTQNWDKKIYPGDYVPINSILRANIYLNNELSELQSFRINGVNVTFVKSSVDKTAYNIGNIPIAKSPQKIDITIDEYIRFEDII